ncbi:MAG: DUF1566 domain-containing protein [Planctomycetota bacterium]|nr:MAG: DUF1566 domain-containing protein [Planctomycetota bacterium]
MKLYFAIFLLICGSFIPGYGLMQGYAGEKKSEPPAGGGGEENASLTYTVTDTGQDRCYGNGKEIAYPKPGKDYYGQDAQYRINEPKYRDNKDGTVTDLNTGLIWQKTPDFKKRNQDDAEKYCENLKLAGKDDWRLPSIKELFSIADFRGNMHTRTPYIDTKVFDFKYPKSSEGERGRPGQRNMDAQYASSTRYLGITMGRDKSAFGFNFADGRIKSYPLHATRYVRAVRGNPEYGKNRFKDNGDGTITDRATGLVWQKADSGKAMNWKDALAYAGKLKLAGRDDWRLPSVKELQSIVDYSKAPDATDAGKRAPAINPVFKLTKKESWFWSGTTHIENQFAYYVCFGQAFSARKRAGRQINAHGAGAVRSDPKEGDPKRWPDGLGPQADEIRIFNYVRCVRGGKVTLRSEGPPVKKGETTRRPPRGDDSKPGSRFINRLDKDGDGRVSKDEFDGPKRRFPRLDRNNDGYIDSDEAPTGPPGRRGERRREPPRGRPPTRSPDENSLQVITVGTGGPSFNPDRCGPSAMIKYRGNYILVDMGEGTANHISKASINFKSIAAFCFTHHHRDHNADAMSIFPQAWSREIVRPVIGPKGTKDLVSFLRKFYKDDLKYRLENRGSSFEELPQPKVHELPLEKPLTIAGMKITVVEVPHTIKTFAFRFEANNRSIVISGDLTYSENLIKLAKDADILVIDSGGIIYEGDNPDKIRRAGRGGRAGSRKGRKKHRAHSTVNEVARMAAEANVKKLVLTHFGPGKVDEAATLELIRAVYKGEVVFAEDMQTHK